MIFRKRETWRVNIPVGQLRASACMGADDFRDRLLTDWELRLEDAAGAKLEDRVRPGDAFVLTAVAQRGRGAPGGLSHLAIAKGLIDDFTYERAGGDRAKVKFRKIMRLEGPAKERAMETPRLNVAPLSPDDAARFF